MLNRDELRTVVATVTTSTTNVGTAVPENMRRFIYKIKVNNQYNGANKLTLRKIEDGGSAENLDYFQMSVQYETQSDPDELKEDSAPLYIVEGTGSTGSSYVNTITDNGNAYLTIWYVDAPA